jgi:hypothetical protein
VPVKVKQRRPSRSVFKLPRTGYIRTTEALRNPKPPARLPQRKGESDREYAARLDAAREEAYDRLRRLRLMRAKRATS